LGRGFVPICFLLADWITLFCLALIILAACLKWGDERRTHGTDRWPATAVESVGTFKSTGINQSLAAMSNATTTNWTRVDEFTGDGYIKAVSATTTNQPNAIYRVRSP